MQVMEGLQMDYFRGKTSLEFSEAEARRLPAAEALR